MRQQQELCWSLRDRLTALLVPVIGRLRESTLESRQLSHLSTHAKVFQQYAGDCREYFPFLTDPNTEFNTLESKGSNLKYDDVRYFDVFKLWNVALADQYYDGNASSASFQYRDSGAAGSGSFSYLLYPVVYLAKPEHWNRETRTNLGEQAGPTNHSLVTFPAQKILLGESLPARLRDAGGVFGTPMCFVDGHAASVADRSLLERGPTASGFSRYTSVPFLSTQWPFFYTLDGVRGRDIR